MVILHPSFLFILPLTLPSLNKWLYFIVFKKVESFVWSTKRRSVSKLRNVMVPPFSFSPVATGTSFLLPKTSPSSCALGQLDTFVPSKTLFFFKYLFSLLYCHILSTGLFLLYKYYQYLSS